MASIPSINQFPCNTLLKSCQNSKLISRNAFYPVKKIRISGISIKKSMKMKQNFTVQAFSWGSQEEPVVPEVAVLEEDPPKETEVPEQDSTEEAVVPEEELPKEPTEIDVLKKQLMDSLYGTNRGLSASSETRAEIGELITQLEVKNPTPAPTEALPLLNGKWVLAYTSFLGLFPLLSSSASLPLVKLEEISQTIDSDNLTVQNSVLFSGPLTTTSITTSAKFEVRSPQRVQIKFEEGIVGTPQLIDSIVLPENVVFMGQKIDLSPFKSLFTSVQDTASSVAKTISSHPLLKFPISSSADSWLLTTYLDDDLRISRGDGGSIFVLIKDGSPLLPL